MSDTAWVTLGGFITLLAGYVYKYVVDERHRKWYVEERKWDIEERTRIAEQARIDRQEVARRVVVVAQEVKNVLQIHDDWEHNEREENKELLIQGVEHAKKAYQEANTVNEKLKELSIGSSNQLDSMEQDIKDIKDNSFNK
jgi:hypothetical protein